MKNLLCHSVLHRVEVSCSLQLLVWSNNDDQQKDQMMLIQAKSDYVMGVMVLCTYTVNYKEVLCTSDQLI